MSRATCQISIVATLISICPLHAEVVATSAPTRRADIDQAESMLLTANGLLERGLRELAAKEYRAFLADFPDHNDADTARYGLAVCLYQTGDLVGAIELLEALAQLDDFAFSTDVKVMLGQSLLAGNDPAGALAAIRGKPGVDSDHPLANQAALIAIESQFALELFADTAESARELLSQSPGQVVSRRAAYLLILSLMELERFDDAERVLTDLDLTEFDGAVTAHLMLARAECFERLGHRDGAMKLYALVVKSESPDYVATARLAFGRLAHVEGRFADAMEMIGPLLASDASETAASANMLAGQIAFEQSQFKDALGHYRAANAASDRVALQAEFHAAQCLLRLERFDEAADAFAEFARNNPDSDWSADALFNRSAALISADKLGDANASLDAFLVVGDNHAKRPDARYLQTWIAHRLGDHQRAAGLAGQFLIDHPDHPRAVDALFIAAESAFMTDQLALALDKFAAFHDRYPTDSRRAFAAFRAGVAAYRLSQYDDAIAWLGKSPIDGDKTAADYAQGLYILGDIAFGREQWHDAEAQFSAFIKIGQDEALVPDALLKIAIAARRMSQPKQSLAALDQLLDRYPDSPVARRAMFERGQSLRESGDIPAAITAFERVASDDTDDELAAHARYQLGLLTINQGDYSRAADLLAGSSDGSHDTELAAETHFQRCAALMALDQYESTAQCYEQFAENFKDHSNQPLAAAQRAIALARFNRDNTAIKAVDQVLAQLADRLSPEVRTQLRYEKAWCHRSLDDMDSAAACYESLLSESANANPLHNIAALEFAEIQADRGDVATARKLLEPICATKQDQSPDAELIRRANYRLALCDFAEERWTDAAARFGDVIDAEISDDMALSSSYYQGESFYRADRHVEAIAPLKRVVDAGQKDDAYRVSLLRLAECQSHEQDWPQARSTFERYLAEYPNDPHAYVAQFGIGWADEHQGNIDQAIESYRQVTTNHQNETAARAQFQIGECLFAQEKHQDAVVELLKVDIQFAYPKWSAAAMYEAGRALELLNKTTEARLQFESVIERFGDSQWAALAKQQLARMRKPTLPGHVSAKENP